MRFRGWIRNTDNFDFIVIDFPDPTNYSLGKLYTTAFYRAVARRLSAQASWLCKAHHRCSRAIPFGASRKH